MFKIKEEAIYYKTIRFKQLAVGDIFEHDTGFGKKLGMKIESDHHHTLNYVNLHNGKTEFLYDESLCYKLYGELTYCKIPVSEVEE